MTPRFITHVSHSASPNRRRRGLTLLEVLIAAVIFSFGVLTLLRIFPEGTAAAMRAESNSRAAMLAQNILAGLRVDSQGYLCFMVGDGIDNDGDGLIDEDIWGVDVDGDGNMLDVGLAGRIIIPGNAQDDDPRADTPYPFRGREYIIDYDGNPEQDMWFGDANYTGDGYNDDGAFLPLRHDMHEAGDEHVFMEGDIDLIDDLGDSDTLLAYNDGYMLADGSTASPGSLTFNLFGDGIFNYDPPMYGLVGIDEEFPDGIDNDGDGLIDEDMRMPSVRLVDNTAAPDHVIRYTAQDREFDPYPQYTNWEVSREYGPTMVGDGVDNDGDGEPGSPRDEFGRAIADGIDNNNDGRIDEGIDEEIWDGIDNDGDGYIDEDVAMAPALILAPHNYEDPDIFLKTPRRIFAPVRWPRGPTGTVAGGNLRWQRQMDLPGVDWDNIEYESDSTFDDQFFFQIFVAPGADHAGNRVDDDGDSFTENNVRRQDWRRFVDEETRDGLDNDGDGLIDEDLGDSVMLGLEDPDDGRHFGYFRIKVVVSWGGNLEDDDGDGFIDEEWPDGIDNDMDGLIDEDTHRYRYMVSGVVPIEMGGPVIEPTQ